MPQTIEAINHARAAEVPIIVAVNKIDKDNADPQRVLTQLAEHELVPEAWGGDTIVVEMAALQDLGIDDLLDQLLVVAELEDLRANPTGRAKGVVLEANLDKGRGPVATVLVDKGVMATFLHDAISAKHYGVKPTGSGRRQSFRHAPMPRMRCTYMEDGPHTKDEIIASVKNGIVAETFTNGQVAIGAGDFTFYIKNGWLIEDGKITAPIKDVNIIGNGPEALGRITMVANDLKIDSGGWTCGKEGQSVPVSQGLPTALVSKLTVGGEDA